MYKKFIKRGLDIIISVLAMPFFVLLFLAVAPCILINDFGPVFYNAERLGKNGKVFKMYKFRSMKLNAPDIRQEDGSTYNGDQDERVTSVGRILRKTSLDEIPQIINVLKGNMSIVGPRPDLPEHIEMYTKLERRKLEVVPGITGYSQAYFRNSIPWKEKIKNDIFYVDHVSFCLDVKICVQTALAVFRHENIYIK